MWSRTKRLLLLSIAVACIAFGWVLEIVLDPLEAAGLAWVGFLLGTVAFGGVVGHWYSRKLETIDEEDERQQKIEWRASRLSHGVLTVGLALLGLVLLVPFFQGSVTPLLWGLLVGSIAVHELSIEYYRRQM